MNTTKLFPLSLTALLVLPLALSAQYPDRDGTVASLDPYVLAAEDFSINPSEEKFTKAIATIMQRSCQQ